MSVLNQDLSRRPGDRGQAPGLSRWDVAGAHRKAVPLGGSRPGHAVTRLILIRLSAVAMMASSGVRSFLWGSNTRMRLLPADIRSSRGMSSGDLVLVREAAKDLLSTDPVLG
jgi:hypothetical protein